MNATTLTARPSHPAMGDARVGLIEIRVSVHDTEPNAFCVQARHAAHPYPLAANVADACEALGLKPAAEIEGNEGGLWARVTVKGEEMAEGNALAQVLYKGALARAAEQAVALAAATTAEA